jgi:hypothetical protein
MTMKNATFKTGLLAAASLVALCGGVVNAGQVTGVTPMVAGAPATAADVNANFDAQTAAINDNDTRIAALEAQLGNISGSLCAAGAFSGEYKLISHRTAIVEDTEAYPDGAGGTFYQGLIGSAMEVTKADMSFYADGTWSYVETNHDYIEQFVSGTPASWNTTVDSTPASGTYTVTTGCKVTLTTPDGTIVMHMSPDLYSGMGKKKETYPASGAPLVLFRWTEIISLTKKNL